MPCIRRSQLTSPHSLLYGPLSRHACGWERRNRRKCGISDIARAWLPEFRAGIHRCRHRSLHVLVVTYFAPHLRLGRARCLIPSVAAGPAPNMSRMEAALGGQQRAIHTPMEGVELSNRGAQIVSPQSATTTAPPAHMAPNTAAPESEESSDEEEKPPVTNPSTNIRVSTRQLPRVAFVSRCCRGTCRRPWGTS